MAQGEIQEERTKEPVEEITETEKQFLKDLYSFMKKRDTPIERIPNLGFKQIDLFVMFKTVRDLGGYQQVTAQQLWKQVYNTLGGNPRSTSAATCTRRHYEKLLLPYECHVRGIAVNIMPQHQPKNYHYANYGKDDDDCQIPVKRKMLSLPVYQNLHTLQPDGHGSAFSLQMQYPQYYQASHAVLPPHVPISSSMLTPQSAPGPQRQFSFNPYHPNPTGRVKEPLEHLRYLAEQYKSSSGLTEPLNLSVKASRPETNSVPASSFTPPSSNKSPRFLNKPSPLYSPHCPQVVQSGRCESQEGEAASGELPHSYPAKAREEAYVADVEDLTVSRSPTHAFALTLGMNEGAATTPKPSSPKTDFTMRPHEDRVGSPDVRELDLRQILPGLPQQNGRGEMEIEMPLSVFNNWLKLCRSSATTRGDKQQHVLPTREKHSGQSNTSHTDVQPTNLTFHMNPQIWSSVDEGQRPRQRDLPSPVQTSGRHHDTSPSPSTSYKPFRSGGILKNAASRDVYPFDQQDVNKSHGSSLPNYWDVYDRGTPIRMNVDSNPHRVPTHFAASKPGDDDEKSEADKSAVLMFNASSTSLLHLTTEEVMKLKKIISSST